MKVQTFICLVLGFLLLGWYGLAIFGVGVIIMIIVGLIKCWYDDKQCEKNRKENAFKNNCNK